MTLEEIAKICWDSRLTVELDSSTDGDQLKVNWLKNNCPSFLTDKQSGAGWYWFELAQDVDSLCKVKKPKSLPEKGCDIGALAKLNRDIFEKNICQEKSRTKVVYGGQAENVQQRIRAHFAVANNKTGALGIKYYPSITGWKVSVFHRGMLDALSSLSKSQREEIRRYMEEGTGRAAIEVVWRTYYGWPLLCKA